MLSNADIRRAIIDKKIIITPYNEDRKNDSRLTPAGFNLSFSLFVVSVNKGRLCDIFVDGGSNDTLPQSLKITIESGDTVLALTHESVWVSSEFAGTLHSKVSYVSKGLGHISTTLDPGWAGQLLISISNPNSKGLDIEIGKIDEKGEITYNTFLTLCLYQLQNKADVKLSDNYEARFDVIGKVVPACLEQEEVKKIQEILPKEARKFNLNSEYKDEEEFSSRVKEYKKAHSEFLASMERILKPTIKRVVPMGKGEGH